MKFQLLIVAIGVFLPCSLAWSNFTTDIMQSVPFTGETLSQYTQYIFPDIFSQCQSFSSMSQSQSITPAVIDWIVNVRRNYLPWCSEIQQHLNNSRDIVTANSLEAANDFVALGDDIEWGLNMITSILTNKGCTQDAIDTFTQTYGQNVTIVMQGGYQWASMLSMSSQMIPQSVVYGFHSALSQIMNQTPQCTLKAVKQAEFIWLEETLRLYTTAADYTVWYIDGIIDSAVYGTMANVARLVDGAVLMSRNTVC